MQYDTYQGVRGQHNICIDLWCLYFLQFISAMRIQSVAEFHLTPLFFLPLSEMNNWFKSFQKYLLSQIEYLASFPAKIKTKTFPSAGDRCVFLLWDGYLTFYRLKLSYPVYWLSPKSWMQPQRSVCFFLLIASIFFPFPSLWCPARKSTGESKTMTNFNDYPTHLHTSQHSNSSPIQYEGLVINSLSVLHCRSPSLKWKSATRLRGKQWD